MRANSLHEKGQDVKLWGQETHITIFDVSPETGDR
jgi:hypothetical protein